MLKSKNIKTVLLGVTIGMLITLSVYFLIPPPNKAHASSCDEDRIISRILYCLDGARVSGGRLSTYCNR